MSDTNLEKDNEKVNEKHPTIYNKTISINSLSDRAKYKIQSIRKNFATPIQLEDYVYYYFHPLEEGREESSLQPQFKKDPLNIERLLLTDLRHFTLKGLQYYMGKKQDTFANFEMFKGPDINLKRLCEELETNPKLIHKKNSIFEADSDTSRVTFMAIKCIWVFYELLKRKFKREVGHMTFKNVDKLFQDKVVTLVDKLKSKAKTIDPNDFTSSDYKDCLSIRDIEHYMAIRSSASTEKRSKESKRSGGATKKRRLR
jgi:hypothetical protein